MDELAQQMDGSGVLPAVVDGLAQQMDGLAQQMDGLAQQMDGLAQQMDGLAQQMDGLRVLPASLLDDCGAWLLTNEAITQGICLCAGFIVYSFVWSIVGSNASKVDQIWSLTPIFYCWQCFYYNLQHQQGEIHYRLLLLCILVTLWGVRLTFNFWRKGGYGTFFTHEEDYRWPILRKKMSPFVFLLFNLSFIATYQNVLLFMIACPAYIVMLGPSEIATGDACVAALFSVFLLMETLADEQHWVFQTYKHSLSAEEQRQDPNPEVGQGFFQSGLYRYSRHPNYFAEQSMWVCVYLFSITDSSSRLVNWTVLGCIQLILLFQGSMSFGESITVAKYPKYKDYQQSTHQCIPCPMITRVKDAKKMS